MSDTKLPKTPPKKILLGTDLSARGDRALDRAAQLARQWGSQLLIVHAIARRAANASDASFTPSWRQSPDPAVVIERRIRRDLREEVDQLKFFITEGDPALAILDTVDRDGCDLIVLGASRSELFGGTLLGNTVEHVMRKSPASVLVVKTRPNEPYQSLLVGTDFTDESRYGLEVAAASFPNARMMVMHAFEVPYRALLSDTSLSHEFAAMERASIQEFVNESNLSPQVRAQIQTVIEHGPPSLMIRRYVEEQHADLTVIGAYSRNFFFHLFGGGHTPRILDSVPSDVLLVRAPRPES